MALKSPFKVIEEDGFLNKKLGFLKRILEDVLK